jgi:hypothetical protein
MTTYMGSCRYPEPIPSGVSVPGWAYLDVEVILAVSEENKTQMEYNLGSR